MAPARHPLRSWVVTMFQRGDLVSPAEGALIATVPRQTVARWLREADIDVKATRLRYLARCQRKAQQYAEGKPMMRRPSKAQMRKMADEAVRRFNAANAGQGDLISPIESERRRVTVNGTRCAHGC